MSALDVQVGGDHYKKFIIQPILLSELVADGDGYFTNFVKYLSRDKENELQDLGKAKHYAELAEELSGYTFNGIGVKAKRAFIRAFVSQYSGSENHVIAIEAMMLGNFKLSATVAEDLLCIANAQSVSTQAERVWYKDNYDRCPVHDATSD